MTPERVLLVEDERAQREPLARFLQRSGHEVVEARTGEEGLEELRRHAFAVLVTDLRLPGIDGLELIRRARDLDEDCGLLLITAYASVESAIEALRLGAHDYILKPLILDEVATKVGRLIEQRELRRENARLRAALQRGAGPADDLVADSKAMGEVVAWVRRAASTRATVLVLGETGVGKEVVARAIHAAGPQAAEPFLAVNLAALPVAMVESELFGHERGAFTGAERRREGLLRAAGEGTVFLDEIAELPLEVQPKLLRALEAREVFPLGSDRPVPFQARLIAATHRDLARRVDERRFREDLYYRLNILRIVVPPLRERPEDVPGLVRHLLGRSPGGRGVEVSPEAMRALCGHRWRGNVRELANVLERARILAVEGRIDLPQLPEDVRGQEDGLSLQLAVDRFERGYIAMALELCQGNRQQAARELGISEATLYRRIEKLGLKGHGVARGGEGP
ncbi:MAG: sigma-54 dependent transcriptional regulator [Planctomycetota bacterium]